MTSTRFSLCCFSTAFIKPTRATGLNASQPSTVRQSKIEEDFSAVVQEKKNTLSSYEQNELIKITQGKDSIKRGSTASNDLLPVQQGCCSKCVIF